MYRSYHLIITHILIVFIFNDQATTENYTSWHTLSLHDALPIWGTAADPEYPWSFKIYGEKGTLAASTMQYDFTPQGKNGKPIHKDVVYEKEKYPEDLTEPDIELNAAPATRQHMLDFLHAIESNGRPIADIEEGHISTDSSILANLSMEPGRALDYRSETQT